MSAASCNMSASKKHCEVQTSWSKQYIRNWPDDIIHSHPVMQRKLQNKTEGSTEVSTQTQWPMLGVPWPISPRIATPQPRTQATQTPWSLSHIRPWTNSADETKPFATTHTTYESPQKPPQQQMPLWPGGPPISDALAERMNLRARRPQDRPATSPKLRGGLEIYLEMQKANEHKPE